jgi:Zn-dependent M16 (insulinase) family peptidase
MKILAMWMAATLVSAALAQQRAIGIGSLTEGRRLHGFRAVAVYRNDADRPMGARFVHERSGFTLDVLEIQSAPQGFIWVTTFPTSNMGEPHTQEHLLLGKGNRGRAVSTREPMALTTSTAFTEQWRTCYAFYTTAGAEIFFDQTERRLDALLHPDYTDEEVRREVRNFGIAENARGGSLRLEEKGTVYNEMVSSMDQPASRLYRESGKMIWGPEHPLSFNSGGTPEALRVLAPENIRRFHKANYHLANMGMLASLPKSVSLETALARFDALLTRVEPASPHLPVKTVRDLPPAQPAPGGEIRFVEYPHRNPQQAGSAMLLWPAERTLDPVEDALLDLFLSTFAGDATTNLYKRFIDSKTRDQEYGARSVAARASDDPGHPVYVMFGDLPAAKMNDADLGELRAKVMEELGRVAAWRSDSTELAEFNRRARSQLTQTRRALAKFVNSPPRFGFRGASGAWMHHLYELNQAGGFSKSVTLKSELAAVEKLLGEKRNIWSEYLKKWKLAGVEPWALGSRPNPSLMAAAQSERDGRLRTELERLERQYNVSDPQAAIRRYKAEYDAATAEIDRETAKATPPKFVDKPPLTLDDQLDFTVTKIGGATPLVASTFDSMTSATTGLALRLDGVGRDRYFALALLPALMTRVGVIDKGKPVSFEEMSERLKNEVLALNATVDGNPATGRVELVVRGSGNDTAESKKAIEWMGLVLFHPDWRVENLPRIRDVVDQSLAALRRGSQRPEEYWVHGPENALWRQDDPLTVLTQSFFAQAHEALRLRWMLKGGPEATRREAAALIEELGKTQGSRQERLALAAAAQSGKPEGWARASGPARALAVEAAKDLEAMLADVPDASLDADWRYLCGLMRRDLLAGPEPALAALDQVRRDVLKAGGARLFVVSSAATRKQLEPGIAELVGRLDRGPAVKANAGGGPVVADRLRGRDAAATHPVYYGLAHANSQGGVFLHSAPQTSYRDTERGKLLDLLASNLYSGSGAHGIFMRTWGAGLAYSNGIRLRPASGRITYYAERTPELPQTMKFVIGELARAGEPGEALIEYAVAGAFSETRAASPYETRGEAMAENLADGLTPEVVSRFRKALLELRKTPGLGKELHERMKKVYGSVLPGLSGKTSAVAGGTYLVVGPEKQLAAWEEYLRTVEGAETKLHRIYGRDFWIAVE